MRPGGKRGRGYREGWYVSLLLMMSAVAMVVGVLEERQADESGEEERKSREKDLVKR